jgi:hypothetical protein
MKIYGSKKTGFGISPKQDRKIVIVTKVIIYNNGKYKEARK